MACNNGSSMKGIAVERTRPWASGKVCHSSISDQISIYRYDAMIATELRTACGCSICECDTRAKVNGKIRVVGRSDNASFHQSRKIAANVRVRHIARRNGRSVFAVETGKNNTTGSTSQTNTSSARGAIYTSQHTQKETEAANFPSMWLVLRADG